MGSQANQDMMASPFDLPLFCNEAKVSSLGNEFALVLFMMSSCSFYNLLNTSLKLL